MTAGQWVDRALNAALIGAASAANRIMAAAIPVRQEISRGADLLAEAEAKCECFEPIQTCVASGRPPAVDGDAPPAGAGSYAGAGHPGTGGHPNIRSTSALLLDTCLALRTAYAVTGRAEDDWRAYQLRLLNLIPELRDRAAQFEAIGD